MPEDAAKVQEVREGEEDPEVDAAVQPITEDAPLEVSEARDNAPAASSDPVAHAVELDNVEPDSVAPATDAPTSELGGEAEVIEGEAEGAGEGLDDPLHVEEPLEVENASPGADGDAPGALGETGAQAAAADAAESPTDDLEEAYYPQTASGAVLTEGEHATWGDLAFTVEGAQGRGWYRVLEDDTGEALLARPGAEGAVWAGLPPQRLLPSVRYAGPEGLATAWVAGEPLRGPLPPEAALAHGLALAQLLRFFEGRGQAVLHVELEGLVRTSAGLRLRFPPRLAPIGEPLPPFYREGLSPPEVQTGAPASGKEGVYVLAATLLALLTGEAPPAEGWSLFSLARVKLPGLPPLLAGALAPAAERLTPSAFHEGLRSLRGALESPSPVFEIAGGTTVGLSPDRPVNEDAYGYVQEVLESEGYRHGLLRACVADGMGGEVAGEVASRAAVETFLAQSPSRPLDSALAQAEWTTQLVWEANHAALEALSGRNGGCTFTGVVVLGERLSLAHVGDTRAYRYRQGEGLRALTHDHSLVRALVANGVLSEEEARTSPDRNKVLRSLGSLRAPQAGYVDDLRAALPEAQDATVPLLPGDLVLLVSDGVWGELDEAALAALVADHTEAPRDLVKALIDAVLEAGASDNAAVVALRRVA